MSVTVDGRFGNAPPDRSLAQRMAALEKGNVHRTLRAQLKRDVKAGRVEFADVLLEPVPEWLASMKLFDLMLAVPKVGRVKTGRILSRAVVSPSKTLGGLSARQRSEVVSLVRR
jgi:hypothetical protein